MRDLNAAAEPGRALDISAATVLVGPDGNLTSLDFVNLMVSIEENIERNLHTAISVGDIMLISDREEWTVADLAARIAELATAWPLGATA